jgi:hypothetical protein
MAKIGILTVPPLKITINSSSRSPKLTGLNLIVIVTAIPGAISPLYSFGYATLKILNYFLLKGVIFIL